MPKKKSPPPAKEAREEPEKYRRMSAAEELETLLPRLVSLGEATRTGGAKGAWRGVYIKALSQCANKTLSSKIAGVSTQAVDQAILRDPEFAAQAKDALEEGIDLVEASAFKSAVYGDMEPIYHQGILCGHVLKYSDAMRALLLKGRRSDVFKERVEQSGNVSMHLTLDEARKRIAESKE